MTGWPLLARRRFGPFFWTQFAGAFNDNLFKNAVALTFAFGAARAAGHDAAATADILINLAAGLFILPFFLFSATAGQLADKFEKSRLIRLVKLAEIAIMALGAAAFFAQSVPLLLVAVFLMGLQSTFFGPAKYSILPQHLPSEAELVAGNALVEMGTFMAILLGTIAAGVLLGAAELGLTAVVLGTLLVAAVGAALSRGIPLAPANAPGLRIDRSPLRASAAVIACGREVRVVWLAILGISWFWFYGAVFIAQLPGFARDVLGGQEEVVTVLLVAFSLGIGAGSMLCERLAGGKVELRLVPVGAFGLTVFALDLVWAAPLAPNAHLEPYSFWTTVTYGRVFADLACIGVSGGLYIVPLYALMQHRSPRERRSRVIAANNIVNAFFMVIAALGAAVLRQAGVSIPELFVLTALLNAVVAVGLFAPLPKFTARLRNQMRSLASRRGQD